MRRDLVDLIEVRLRNRGAFVGGGLRCGGVGVDLRLRSGDFWNARGGRRGWLADFGSPSENEIAFRLRKPLATNTAKPRFWQSMQRGTGVMDNLSHEVGGMGRFRRVECAEIEMLAVDLDTRRPACA